MAKRRTTTRVERDWDDAKVAAVLRGFLSALSGKAIINHNEAARFAALMSGEKVDTSSTNTNYERLGAELASMLTRGVVLGQVDLVDMSTVLFKAMGLRIEDLQGQGLDSSASAAMVQAFGGLLIESFDGYRLDKSFLDKSMDWLTGVDSDEVIEDAASFAEENGGVGSVLQGIASGLSVGSDLAGTVQGGADLVSMLGGLGSIPVPE